MIVWRRVAIAVLAFAVFSVLGGCELLVAPTPFGAPAESAADEEDSSSSTPSEPTEPTDPTDPTEPTDPNTDGEAREEPGVTITPTTVGATEGGADGFYEVVLTTEPTAEVTVSTAVTNGEVTVSPTSLTFTAATWDTPQTVTIAAVDDAVVEGAHSDSVAHSVTTADTDYAGIAVDDVSVSVVDNDGSSSTITVDNPIVPTFSINNGGVTLNRSVSDAWNLAAVAGSGVTIAAFDWLVNGASTGAAQLFTLNSTDPAAELGANTLTLFVLIDGNWYSDSFVFQVVEN